MACNFTSPSHPWLYIYMWLTWQTHVLFEPSGIIWLRMASVRVWLENLPETANFCSGLLKTFMAQSFLDKVLPFFPCLFSPTGTMSTIHKCWVTHWMEEGACGWEVIWHIFLRNGGAEKPKGNCKHWKGSNFPFWRRTWREPKCLALCHCGWWRQ